MSSGTETTDFNMSGFEVDEDNDTEIKSIIFSLHCLCYAEMFYRSFFGCGSGCT